MDITGEISESTPKPNWEPIWYAEIGNGCELGIALDDHCLVVLAPDEEAKQWTPTTHIPFAAARRIAELYRDELIEISRCRGD